MKILLTGSQGFIGSYICQELLAHGYEVMGVDNFSKYGEVKRPQDNHKNFKFYLCDILSSFFLEIVRNEKPDMIIAGGAMIGGIAYFNKFSYDLLAKNERIIAQTFDAAIEGFKNGYIKRIVVLSSSMVFEQVNVYPTPETEVKSCPPPYSSYGFQKLSCEYFAMAAFEQYQLPYTILRPFNAAGAGECDSIAEHEETSGNVKLLLSHVLPDFVNKILKGQNPLRILGSGNQIRAYTNGKDIARGVRLAIESERAINNDFNISTPVVTTVLELAEKVWKILKPNEPFNYILEPGFKNDVERRIPSTKKAQQLLGFRAEIPLEDSIREVIHYMKGK